MLDTWSMWEEKSNSVNKLDENRVRREQLAHDQSDVLQESYRLKNRFHHIWTYPSRMKLEDLKYSYLSNLAGKRVLDYGCGWGDSSEKYYLKGADVTGIDISEKFISSAVSRFNERHYDSNRYRFLVMDAHELRFNDGEFDCVVGDGILHHLDTKSALSEIYRVLKPGGRVLLFEPLAGHPLLKIFRLLTPRARTIDEKPLTAKDLRAFSESNPWASEHAYCGIFEAPIAMLTSITVPEKPDNALLRLADLLEQWTIRRKILLSWNQYVLLNFTK